MAVRQDTMVTRWSSRFRTKKCSCNLCNKIWNLTSLCFGSKIRKRNEAINIWSSWPHFWPIILVLCHWISAVDKVRDGECVAENKTLLGRFQLFQTGDLDPLHTTGITDVFKAGPSLLALNFGSWTIQVTVECLKQCWKENTEILLNLGPENLYLLETKRTWHKKYSLTSALWGQFKSTEQLEELIG